MFPNKLAVQMSIGDCIYIDSKINGICVHSGLELYSILVILSLNTQHTYIGTPGNKPVRLVVRFGRLSVALGR